MLEDLPSNCMTILVVESRAIRSSEGAKVWRRTRMGERSDLDVCNRTRHERVYKVIHVEVLSHQ